jgi:hypothetical protein
MLTASQSEVRMAAPANETKDRISDPRIEITIIGAASRSFLARLPSDRGAYWGEPMRGERPP